MTDLEDKTNRIKRSLLNLIPTSEQHSWGQIPMILIHQVRGSLRQNVSFAEMQIAYNQLYDERKVFPEQNFSQTILGRCYKK